MTLGGLFVKIYKLLQLFLNISKMSVHSKRLRSKKNIIIQISHLGVVTPLAGGNISMVVSEKVYKQIMKQTTNYLPFDW